MRIVFLCGSLEPGRDGVGDYVRCLGTELLRQEHSVVLIAINDKFITDIQETTEFNIPILRISNGINKDVKLRKLRSWIEVYNPEWLSLQYVPFSFDPKGLHFGLSKFFWSIARNKKWHVMVHEVCVGLNTESNIKEKLWGKAQLYLLNSLLKVIKPVVVHTHTALYKKQLEGLSMDVQILPLFSNIPVINEANVLNKLNNRLPQKEADLVIFGGIHKGAPIAEFAREVNAYEMESGLRLNLVVIGRSGPEQEKWIGEWQAKGLSVKQWGEQCVEKISEILSEANYGIFTTPIALVEKSGAVAAMREHRMHLLCVSRVWTPSVNILGQNPFKIMVYKAGNLRHFLNTKPDFSYIPTLQIIAKQFIANLSTIN